MTSSVQNCIKQHDRKRHTRAATVHIRRRSTIRLQGQFFFFAGIPDVQRILGIIST